MQRIFFQHKKISEKEKQFSLVKIILSSMFAFRSLDADLKTNR